MTEMENIKKLWTGLDAKLDRNWKLNVKVLRRVNMDKARSKMKSLIIIKGVSLAFYLMATICFVSFAIANWHAPYMVATGIIFGIWTLAISIASIHELELIRQIDYAEPVTVLQKKLNRLKLAIIRYLRLGVWVFPLYFGFIILFFKLLFGVDIVEQGDQSWLWANLVLSLVVFLPLAIWMHNKLRPENADRRWMNKLLRGNGSQIYDAERFIQEIEEFEGEMG